MTADPFGPQGDHVRALIARAALLTSDEAIRLSEAWRATQASALSAAWGAAWGAARDAARAAAGAAAGAAARAALGAALGAAAGAAALGAAALGAVWNAAGGAAGALAVRHLIGPSFTQEHYDLLTGPWRAVIGPVHPDDVEAES